MVFTNVLLVFTCIEKNDKISYVREAATEVKDILDSIRSAQKVVLMPFAHLSSDLAEPAVAVKCIDKMASNLKLTQVNVSVGSFGYHKDFHLGFRGKGHPLAVSFRTIPNEARKAEPRPSK